MLMSMDGALTGMLITTTELYGTGNKYTVGYYHRSRLARNFHHWIHYSGT